MRAQRDRVIATLHRRLDTETDADLHRGMHYPTRWDPFFTDFMTLAEIYHYPTQHFESTNSNSHSTATADQP